MCTPWTLRRFIVGHQPKAGRHKPSNTRNPLEDETNNPVFTSTEQSNKEQPSSSPRQGCAATALVTWYDYSRRNEPGSRMSVIKRGKHKRKVTVGSNHTSSSSSSLGDVDGGANVDDTDWPPFTDEDYIVFCFEEDGEFHLVMDENLQSQDCFEIGHSPRPSNQKDQGDNDGDLASPSTSHMIDIMEDNNSMNRTDCFLPNKAIEEERFVFSPRLQSDGIKSLTRFKEVEYDDVEVVKARVRVDEEIDYEEMDGIKRRGQCHLDEEADALSEDDDLECYKTSMECRDGSVESTGSSQPDWVRHLQVTKTDQEIGLSSSSPSHDELSSSKKGKLITLMYKKGEDEESVYLSSKSQQGESQGSGDEHSNEEESAETSDTSDLEEDEIAALDSAKSKGSIDSSSSFEFPVLQWDWIGSPVKWPKSKSRRLRKHKSSRVGLRCCRF